VPSDSLCLIPARADGQLVCSRLSVIGEERKEKKREEKKRKEKKRKGKKRKEKKRGREKGGVVDFPSSSQSHSFFPLIALFCFARPQLDGQLARAWNRLIANKEVRVKYQVLLPRKGELSS